MKIGNKLKQGRTEKNLTQEETATILNISRSTVSSWEVNRTYPDLEMLVTLSDLYDISLDSMLREDEKMVHTLTHEMNTGRNTNTFALYFFTKQLRDIFFFVGNPILEFLFIVHLLEFATSEIISALIHCNCQQPIGELPIWLIVIY